MKKSFVLAALFVIATVGVFANDPLSVQVKVSIKDPKSADRALTHWIRDNTEVFTKEYVTLFASERQETDGEIYREALLTRKATSFLGLLDTSFSGSLIFEATDTVAKITLKLDGDSVDGVITNDHIKEIFDRILSKLAPALGEVVQ